MSPRLESQNGQLKLAAVADPRSPAAEAFRTLRTNIQFSSLDHELRTILVTSPGPREGKSTILANLAIAIAEAGRRVIAVDCDLRRPALHQFFGLDHATGLTSALLEDDPGALPLQETFVPGLRLLASGPQPPNPSELLGSQRFNRVVEALKQEADIVLFDAPPVLAVADAVVLAARLDGVLLVISAGKTKREPARRARQQLERVNARLIGLVLNDVKIDRSLYQYYGR